MIEIIVNKETPKPRKSASKKQRRDSVSDSPSSSEATVSQPLLSGSLTSPVAPIFPMQWPWMMWSRPVGNGQPDNCSPTSSSSHCK